MSVKHHATSQARKRLRQTRRLSADIARAAPCELGRGLGYLVGLWWGSAPVCGAKASAIQPGAGLGVRLGEPDLQPVAVEHVDPAQRPLCSPSPCLALFQRLICGVFTEQFGDLG